MKPVWLTAWVPPGPLTPAAALPPGYLCTCCWSTAPHHTRPGTALHQQRLGRGAAADSTIMHHAWIQGEGGANVTASLEGVLLPERQAINENNIHAGGC